MFNLGRRKEPRLREIRSVGECSRVLEEDFAIIFKHSTLCDLSQAAHREVLDFCETHESAPVYLVSVIDYPEVTRHIAEKTAVSHESPQVIALRKGEVVGAASHRRVTAALLNRLSA
jgi:bacillithiol system protein YtxJ